MSNFEGYHVLPSPTVLAGLEKIPRSDNYRCKICGAEIFWFQSPNGIWHLFCIPEAHSPNCHEVIRLGDLADPKPEN